MLPVTSLRCSSTKRSNERVSTGLASLDDMLGGKGYFRASTVLLSGTAGTGKTTLAAHFVDAACARGEKCLYFLFEESPQQMIRNMRSAGIDLQQLGRQGLAQVSRRPARTATGLETHLLEMHHAVEVFDPDVVVLDPITNLMAVGTQIRRARHAHARHRLPEDARRHRAVHQPHLRRRKVSRRPSR